MKKMIFASAISILLSIALAAQTPTPPPRAARPSSASSASASGAGTGAEGKIASLNAAQFNQGILELKVKLDALNVEFEPKRKEIQASEEELNNLRNKIQTQGSSAHSSLSFVPPSSRMNGWPPGMPNSSAYCVQKEFKSSKAVFAGL